MSARDRPAGALAAARHARGWSQAGAAHELAALAAARGFAAASPASLKTQLSRWENGHARPDPPYPDLLAELFGRSAAELGLRPDPSPAGGPAERFRARLALAAEVDADVLVLRTRQLGTLRALDARLGTAGSGAAVRALVADLAEAAAHTPGPARRRPLQALLAAAATLAAEQALDAGEPDRAWELTGIALGAARDAPGTADGGPTGTSTDTLAAAVACRAEVLTAVGLPAAALETLAEAPGRTGAGDLGLAVARAAAQAALGRAGPALATLDAVCSHTGPQVELALLHHGRGRVLATLGDPGALTVLRRALEPPPRAVRVRVALHAELARAHALLGDDGEAARQAALARALGEAVGAPAAAQYPPSEASSSSAAR